jgi:ADP-ribosylglycohydrolase
MIGLIAGDIIGSVYEWKQAGTKDFPLFNPQSRWTDDTVLSLAIAEAIMTGRPYAECLRAFGRKYPQAGYGGLFKRWINADNADPYNSWGNGSGMRVAAIGYAFNTEEEVLNEAEKSALPTHNHPEGIKGAQAIALSVDLARTSATKDQIRGKISELFNYDLSRTVEEIQPTYHFEVSCQGSVPEAIISFLDSESYEDSIRNAIYLGGDSDTIGAMAGAIAEAWYGNVPNEIQSQVKKILPTDHFDVLTRFSLKYV